MFRRILTLHYMHTSKKKLLIKLGILLMISLNSINISVKEIYQQLCLSHHFGGIRTMNIHKRYAQLEKTKTIV